MRRARCRSPTACRRSTTSTGTISPTTPPIGTVTVTDTPAAPDHGDRFRELRSHPDVGANIERYRDEFDRPVDHRLLLTLEIGDLPDRSSRC